ncbi:hypothetical protein [Polynucleobacter sp. JS-Safj-400b-B2]|nr:hypothetical protein [Polynucleobacter sp. JS-Safj-400b-B2]
MALMDLNGILKSAIAHADDVVIRHLCERNINKKIKCTMAETYCT